jgi:hypothetical protein
MGLTRRTGVDQIELVSVLSDILQRVGLNEGVGVARHRVDVNADHLATSASVAGTGPARAAKEIQDSHYSI